MGEEGTSALDRPQTAEAWLAIWGMYCPECQTRVEEALRSMNGVLAVEVDWRYMCGRVVYAPNKVEVDGLIECIRHVETRACYQFWAAAGPDVTRAVRGSWTLKGTH